MLTMSSVSSRQPEWGKNGRREPVEDDMTVKKLLMQNSVRAVVGKLNEQKDGAECIVAIYVDGEDNLQCIASDMTHTYLIGLLEMAKHQTLEEWAIGWLVGEDNGPIQ